MLFNTCEVNIMGLLLIRNMKECNGGLQRSLSKLWRSHVAASANPAVCNSHRVGVLDGSALVVISEQSADQRLFSRGGLASDVDGTTTFPWRAERPLHFFVE